MKQNFFATCIGLLVLIIVIFFAGYLYISSHKDKNKNQYIVTAEFQNIEGINHGSDIMIAGIKVGTVKQISLTNDLSNVLVTMSINNNIAIPSDSSAAILTSGLIGNKYIMISPGLSTEYLKAFESIKRTQSSLNIEYLIGKIIYSFGDKG